ncbi:unnamed protein product, partial [Rotaria sp. Silwood2]
MLGKKTDAESKIFLKFYKNARLLGSHGQSSPRYSQTSPQYSPQSPASSTISSSISSPRTHDDDNLYGNGDL